VRPRVCQLPRVPGVLTPNSNIRCGKRSIGKCGNLPMRQGKGFRRRGDGSRPRTSYCPCVDPTPVPRHPGAQRRISPPRGPSGNGVLTGARSFTALRSFQDDGVRGRVPLTVVLALRTLEPLPYPVIPERGACTRTGAGSRLRTRCVEPVSVPRHPGAKRRISPPRAVRPGTAYSRVRDPSMRCAPFRMTGYGDSYGSLLNLFLQRGLRGARRVSWSAVGGSRVLSGLGCGGGGSPFLPSSARKDAGNYCNRIALGGIILVPARQERDGGAPFWVGGEW
jgi:hypothetical protein